MVRELVTQSLSSSEGTAKETSSVSVSQSPSCVLLEGILLLSQVTFKAKLESQTSSRCRYGGLGSLMRGIPMCLIFPLCWLHWGILPYGAFQEWYNKERERDISMLWFVDLDNCQKIVYRIPTNSEKAEIIRCYLILDPSIPDKIWWQLFTHPVVLWLVDVIYFVQEE